MAARGAASEAVRDGRVERGTRNRDAIVEALVELVRSGELFPTAEAVAARAGVGTRTVFRHFEDMESLYAELNARVQEEVRPLLQDDFAGSVEMRVTKLVATRAAVFERIAPFRRAAQVQRWRSPFLQAEQHHAARQLRAHLLGALPELESGPEITLEAIDLIASVGSWERLRGDQKLGRDRARAVIEEALLGLLRQAGID